jgi:prepilin-type N-terminal cleavage/methylation domain-containing protein
MKNNGFTLPEVMVALGIFAIGMIASFALQMTSLSVSRRTEQVKTMNALATSTLEVKRQELRKNVTLSSTNQTCATTPSGYTCDVEVKPCSLSGSTISCSTTAVANPVGFYVTVNVSTTNQTPLSLSTLVRKKRL